MASDTGTEGKKKSGGDMVSRLTTERPIPITTSGAFGFLEKAFSVE